VGIFESPGRISAKNVTLKRCVRGAYGLPESQIIGGPKWAEQDRFQIEAKAIGAAGGHELMLMLQTLLSERFKLVLHREQREVSGYRLVVDKRGVKMPRSASDRSSVGQSERGRIAAQGYSMAQLALKLADALQQPIEDATSLSGKFDFQLEWAPDDLQPKPGSPASDSDRPSIFAALQEQLGLKLEPSKIRAEVLVVDSAVKPSVN
jgi:uncharacterized protein (TIGR03435 family)